MGVFATQLKTFGKVRKKNRQLPSRNTLTSTMQFSQNCRKFFAKNLKGYSSKPGKRGKNQFFKAKSLVEKAPVDM